MSDSATDASPETIGIFGAGKSGTALARRALASGYRVKIATSASPADTAMMVDIVAPGAEASDPAQLAEDADIVIIAVPLRRLPDLPVHTLAGRVVIDLMNYWPPIDGILDGFEGADEPTSVIVRDALPASVKVVKTFNHLGYHQMEDLARMAGASDRAAVALAGDDPAALEIVSRFAERVGFDPVPIGTLADSAPMEPGRDIFGQQLTADELRHAVSRDRDRDRVSA